MELCSNNIDDIIQLIIESSTIYSTSSIKLDPEKLKRAEKVLLDFQLLSNPYEICKRILELNLNEVSCLMAGNTIRFAINNEFSLERFDHFKQLQKDLLQFFADKHNKFKKNVIDNLSICVSIIFKKSLINQNYQSEIINYIFSLIQSQIRNQVFIGTEILKCILNELSMITTYTTGYTLDIHLDIKQWFKQNKVDEYYVLIFKCLDITISNATHIKLSNEIIIMLLECLFCLMKWNYDEMAENDNLLYQNGNTNANTSNTIHIPTVYLNDFIEKKLLLQITMILNEHDAEDRLYIITETVLKLTNFLSLIDSCILTSNENASNQLTFQIIESLMFLLKINKYLPTNQWLIFIQTIDSLIYNELMEKLLSNTDNYFGKLFLESFKSYTINQFLYYNQNYDKDEYENFKCSEVISTWVSLFQIVVNNNNEKKIDIVSMNEIVYEIAMIYLQSKITLTIDEQIINGHFKTTSFQDYEENDNQTTSNEFEMNNRELVLICSLFLELNHKYWQNLIKPFSLIINRMIEQHNCFLNNNQDLFKVNHSSIESCAFIIDFVKNLSMSIFSTWESSTFNHQFILTSFINSSGSIESHWNMIQAILNNSNILINDIDKYNSSIILVFLTFKIIIFNHGIVKKQLDDNGTLNNKWTTLLSEKSADFLTNFIQAIGELDSTDLSSCFLSNFVSIKTNIGKQLIVQIYDMTKTFISFYCCSDCILIINFTKLLKNLMNYLVKNLSSADQTNFFYDFLSFFYKIQERYTSLCDNVFISIFSILCDFTIQTEISEINKIFIDDIIMKSIHEFNNLSQSFLGTSGHQQLFTDVPAYLPFMQKLEMFYSIIISAKSTNVETSVISIFSTLFGQFYQLMNHFNHFCIIGYWIIKLCYAFFLLLEDCSMTNFPDFLHWTLIVCTLYIDNYIDCQQASIDLYSVDEYVINLCGCLNLALKNSFQNKIEIDLSINIFTKLIVCFNKLPQLALYPEVMDSIRETIINGLMIYSCYTNNLDINMVEYCLNLTSSSFLELKIQSSCISNGFTEILKTRQNLVIQDRIFEKLLIKKLLEIMFTSSLCNDSLPFLSDVILMVVYMHADIFVESVKEYFMLKHSLLFLERILSMTHNLIESSISSSNQNLKLFRLQFSQIFKIYLNNIRKSMSIK